MSGGRLMTYVEQLTMVTEVCYSCNIVFGIPDTLRAKRISDQANFFCPNGHPQHYVGKTEVQKANEAREAAERHLIAQRAATAEANRRLEAEKRSHASTKGNLTKSRQRAAAGVCDCCNRTFQQLARHMASQHPNFVKAVKP